MAFIEMTFRGAVFCAVFPAAAFSQDSITCGASYTAPQGIIVRATNCENTAADMKVAVGLERILATTNCGVRIRCKTSGTSWASAELQGTTVSNGMFKRALTSDNSAFDQIFDPRVIYDDSNPEDPRFWVVAVENAYDESESEYSGRLHIAVSTDAEPDSFTPSFWHKYTADGTGVAGAAITPPTLSDPPIEGLGWFPDRPSIAVSDLYLAIVFKVAVPGAFLDTYSVAMIYEKDDLMGGGTPNLVHWQTIDELDDEVNGERTWGHELFVDQSVEADGIDEVHKFYMITIPDLADGWGAGDLRESLRLGALWLDDTTWTYNVTDMDLLEEGAEFRCIESAPGGRPPGQDVGDCGENGFNDCNLLAFSLFFNGVTRIQDGNDTRYLWTIHDIRPEDDADGPSRLQVLKIDPHGFPDNAPEIVEVVRRDVDPQWVHDGSVGVNACGDWAVSYTLSEDDQYPEFWSWIHTLAGTNSYALVKSGAADQYLAGSSWADYSGTTSDPTNPQYYWGLLLVVYDDNAGDSSDQWSGWLARYSFSASCSPQPKHGHVPLSVNGDLDQDGAFTEWDIMAAIELVRAGRRTADFDRNGRTETDDLAFFVREYARWP